MVGTRHALAALIVITMAGRAAVASPAPQWLTVQRMVVEEAARAGLSPELALAVAKIESGFNPRAHSGAGARGVMQIMPATARGEFGVGPELLWNPSLNIRMGVAYLKSLLDYYGAEDLALSHYNGGSRVGPPPYSRVIPATRDYVDAVLAWKRRFQGQGGAKAVLAEIDGIKPRRVMAGPVETSRPPSPTRWSSEDKWDGGWALNIGERW